MADTAVGEIMPAEAVTQEEAGDRQVVCKDREVGETVGVGGQEDLLRERTSILDSSHYGKLWVENRMKLLSTLDRIDVKKHLMTCLNHGR